MTTPDINDLITTALKETIQKAVAASADKLETLDTDVAGALVYFNRKCKDLEATIKELRTRITQLEKHADMHAEQRKDTEKRVNNLEEHAAFLIEHLQKTSNITLACQDEIKELRKANEDRDQEREDILADLVEDVVNDKFGNYDITDKVRDVLADAQLKIRIK